LNFGAWTTVRARAFWTCLVVITLVVVVVIMKSFISKSKTHVAMLRTIRWGWCKYTYLFKILCLKFGVFEWPSTRTYTSAL